MITVVRVLHIISCVVIILAVMFQTTKSEGLTGTIGGKSESTFKRGGLDDLLERITTYGAVFFFVLSAVVAWLYYRAT
jgi:preprotein translocase subunit SecG